MVDTVDFDVDTSTVIFLNFQTAMVVIKRKRSSLSVHLGSRRSWICAYAMPSGINNGTSTSGYLAWHSALLDQL